MVWTSYPYCLSFNRVTSSLRSRLLIMEVVPDSHRCGLPALFGKGFSAPRHYLARFRGGNPPGCVRRHRDSVVGARSWGTVSTVSNRSKEMQDGVRRAQRQVHGGRGPL